MKKTIQELLFALLLAILGISGGLLFLIYQQELPVAVNVFTKVVPMLSLLVWLLSKQVAGPATLIAVGLLFAALGDIGMAFANGPVFFFALVLNMLFLLCYISFFVSADRRLNLAWLAVPSAIIVPIAVLIFPALGPFAVPVLAYCVLSCVLLWRSLSQLLQKTIPLSSRFFGMVAAVFLVASDSLLGMTMFHAIPESKGIQLSVMLLWWGGHFLMMLVATASILRERQSPR